MCVRVENMKLKEEIIPTLKIILIKKIIQMFRNNFSNMLYSTPIQSKLPLEIWNQIKYNMSQLSKVYELI
jgi:hypothetical protein